MKKFTKLIAVLLFAAMLITTTLPAVTAIDIEIDIGGLFDDVEDTTGNNKTDDETEDNTTTVIPDDTDDEEETPDLPDDNDTSSRPSTNTSSKDDKDEEEDKPKEEEKVYNSTFSDVTEDAWYYSYVTSLASKGIITGYPDGTFAPQGNITRAEFIKLLVQCMGYELTENDVFEDVTKDDAKDWYYTYVSAAADNKIISTEEYGKEFKGDEKIKRDEVAALIIKATGVETGKYASPYVDTVDKNIVALYAICLMQGTVDDKSGDRYFFPEWNITRAEVSTVFSRLLEYNADKEKFVEEKMAEYGITEMKLLSLPKTEEQFYETVKSAGLTPALSFYANVNNPTEETALYLQNNFHNGFLACCWSHPEYFSYYELHMSTSDEIIKNGVFRFSLRTAFEYYSPYSAGTMYTQSKEKAVAAANQILLENPNATKKQLCDLVHDYVIENVTYSEEESDILYTAYGALVIGKAACQGYAGAFNMICRNLGIDSVAVVNNEHMWNAVKLDGKHFYYDCTWDDDRADSVKNTYKGVSESVIKQTHGEFTFYKFAMA